MSWQPIKNANVTPSMAKSIMLIADCPGDQQSSRILCIGVHIILQNYYVLVCVLYLMLSTSDVLHAAQIQVWEPSQGGD